MSSFDGGVTNKSLKDIGNMNGMKFVHVNIRSLWPKLTNLRTMLGNIDFLGITETWLNQNYSNDMLDIQGYSILRNDRLIDKKGGGVACYIKSKYFKFCSTIEGLNISNQHIEMLNIVHQTPNHKKQLVTVVYRPPTGDVKIFLKHIKDIVSLPEFSKMEKIILGDFNIDYRDRDNVYTKSLFDFEKILMLKQYILDPTRIAKKASTIDLIFTDSSFVHCSGCLTDAISDHQFIYIIRKKVRNTNHSTLTKGRSYRNFNLKEFENFIEDELLNYDMNNVDPETMWMHIEKMLTAYLDKNCPLHDIKLKFDGIPWITQEIIEVIQDRNKCNRAHYKLTKNIQTESNESKLELLSFYRDSNLRMLRYLRNTATRMIRNAKDTYVMNALEENKEDYKRFWRDLNILLDPTKGKKNEISLLDEDNNLICPSNIPDLLNTYYAELGDNNDAQSNQMYIDVASYKRDTNLSEFAEVTLEEISNIIKSINIYKPSGIQNIPTRILKQLFTHKPELLMILFNKSLQTTLFPESWKIGIVSPIPKQGNLLQMSNWRPITILPLPGKLLEKCIHKRLVEYFNENNLISEKQYGFQANKSTMQAVMELTKYLYEKRDIGNTIGCLFIDFSKAFNMVSHKILIQKLKAGGLRNQALNWISSYLNNRKQCTRANNIKSSVRLVANGVPQGSCLGPLLFIYYINDLIEPTSKDNMILFADDVVIYEGKENAKDLETSLQGHLNVVVRWCTNNNMKMNVSKTKLMTFNTRTNDHCDLYTPDGCIGRTNSYKYLGVWLDSSLSMDKHLNNGYKMAYQKVFKLKKLRKQMSTNTAMLVYKQTILPYFEYCDFLIDACSKREQDKIEKLQYRALRIIHKIRNPREVRRVDLLQLSGMKELRIRRKCHLLNQMHVWKKRGKWLKKQNRTTRNQRLQQFYLPKPKTEEAKKSPYYRGAKLWLKLPPNIRQMEEKEEFKKATKKHFGL